MKPIPQKVLGELFYYERGIRGPKGRIWLRHRQWSLLGNGRDMYEAYRDLYYEARDLWPVLWTMKARGERGSLEWHRMYNFVMRFTGVKR